VAVATLCAAAAARPSAAWSVRADAGIRRLAEADGLALVATVRHGTVEIGTAAGGRAQLEPLAAAAAGRPVVVYTAATESAGRQELVGVARDDVDRVDAVLVDGSEIDLPLNGAHAFSYLAAAPAAAAAGIVAYAGGSSVGALRLPQTATSGAAAAAAPAVYGLFRSSLRAETLRLARVDPRTLAQAPGPTLPLGGAWASFMALSPGGEELALGLTSTTKQASQQLLLVDLPTMRIVRRETLAGDATIRVLSWPRDDRLIEIRQVLSRPYQRDVVSRTAQVVDPRTGGVVASRPLTNRLAIRGSVTTPRGLVLLLGSSSLHGPDVRLALVTPDGLVRTASVPVGAEHGTTRPNVLAVDARAGHAYVVVADGTVFDVDLDTMTSVRHTVAAPAGAALVAPPISRLQASVFGGRLAVAGLFSSAAGRPAQGVYLVDPTTWKATVLDPAANLFEAFGDRLLTYGLTTPPRRTGPPTFEEGRGLSLYDAAGKLVAHLYGTRTFQYVALAPGFGHVVYSGPSSSVKLNPRSGRVVWLGPNDELIFDLETGAALGHAAISTARPPLGPPLLIFPGAPTVGG
jgi:hypothetical protein